MKKIMGALCAMMLLTMSACQKENNEPENNPAGGGDNPTVQIPTGEGYFNPTQRLVSISVDGTTMEEWTWVNDVVTTIMTADENGNLVESSWYEYDNYRMMSTTATIEGMPVDVSYTYSGNKLSMLTVYSGPLEVMNAVFTRNAAGKINHVTMEVNELLLAMISELFGNGFPDIFSHLRTTPTGSKLAINSTAIEADLTWQGDNVSQMLFNAQVDLDITLGELREQMDLESMLGAYASVLSLLPDSTLIPVTFTVTDTSNYTYDNMNNPFCGFLGRLDPTVLSANNATTVENNMAANVSATLNVGIMSIPFSFPIPLPIEIPSETRTYTYTNAGFPATYTNGEGNVTQYTYQQ